MGTRRTSILAWAIENLADITVALAVAAAIVAALYGVRALVVRGCKRLGPHHPFATVVLTTVRKTRLWFLIALALQLVQGYLHPPQDVAKASSPTCSRRCRSSSTSRSASATSLPTRARKGR